MRYYQIPKPIFDDAVTGPDGKPTPLTFALWLDLILADPWWREGDASRIAVACRVADLHEGKTEGDIVGLQDADHEVLYRGVCDRKATTFQVPALRKKENRFINVIGSAKNTE